MLKISGEKKQTLDEAAQYFGVSKKTIRQWIARGIIPQPPTEEYGLRDVAVFPDKYLEQAGKLLNQYREQKRKGHLN